MSSTGDGSVRDYHDDRLSDFDDRRDNVHSDDDQSSSGQPQRQRPVDQGDPFADEDPHSHDETTEHDATTPRDQGYAATETSTGADATDLPSDRSRSSVSRSAGGSPLQKIRGGFTSMVVAASNVMSEPAAHTTWGEWCDSHSATRVGRLAAATLLLLRQLHGDQAINTSDVGAMANKPIMENSELAKLIERRTLLRKELEVLEGEIERKHVRLPRVRDKEISKTATQAKLRQTFNLFDEDKSGFITAHEFQMLTYELGEPLDEQEVKEAMKHLDTDKNNKLSFDEFCKWWESDYQPDDKTLVQIRALQNKLHTTSLSQKFRKRVENANRLMTPRETGVVDKARKTKPGSASLLIDARMGAFSSEKASIALERSLSSKNQFVTTLKSLAAPADTQCYLSFNFALRKGINDFQVGELQGSLTTVLSAIMSKTMKKEFSSLSVQPTKAGSSTKVLRVTLFFNKDVKAIVKQNFGLDFDTTTAVKKFDAKLSFDANVNDFFLGGETRLHDVCSSRLQVNLEMEKDSFERAVHFLERTQGHNSESSAFDFVRGIKELKLKLKFSNALELVRDFCTNLPSGVFAGWPRKEMGDDSRLVNKEVNGSVHEAVKRIKQELIDSVSVNGFKAKRMVAKLIPLIMRTITGGTTNLSEAGVSPRDMPFFFLPFMEVVKGEKSLVGLYDDFRSRVVGVHSVVLQTSSEKYALTLKGFDFINLMPEPASEARGDARRRSQKPQ